MIHFLTFGGGSDDMAAAARRLVDQASKSGFFDICTAYTEIDLENDLSFQERHGEFLKSHPRGFGYWLWKPYLIGRYLKTMTDGDLLFYCDAGCEINPLADMQFQKLVAYLKAKDFLCFILENRDCETWTKFDLIDRYPLLRGRKQIEATVLGFVASQSSRAMAAQWTDLCCTENYRFLDDSPSRVPNHESFKEHRHDQSCLNAIAHPTAEPLSHHLLYPKRKIETPFMPLRNRSGKTQTRFYTLGPLGVMIWIRPTKHPKFWVQWI